MLRFVRFMVLVAAVGTACGALPGAWSLPVVRAQDDLPAMEERAIRAAVARVAPSVVRIETVGGLQSKDGTPLSAGPTTGLVVSADGHVVSSAFNFVHQPTSILLTLADGQRAPAKLVATDHNRKLTLLKIEVSQPLTVPESVPVAEIQVGAWAIAVGRTFDGGQPNLSVGIVSGLNRVWGKAIQTDAKISPGNYGGPLIDIHGRVLGILAPLEPDNAGEFAGVQWYDSGIGFAVPLEQVNQLLPRLVAGTDLRAGLLGLSVKGTNPYGQPPELVAVLPNSPAYKAALKPGDKIVEADGEPIESITDFHYAIKGRYAGDTMKLVVLRGETRIEQQVELVDAVPAYQRPFLGVLPRRDPDQPAGVRVRHVYPESAAAKAGIQPDDVITQINGQPVAHRGDLANQLVATEFGKPLKLDFQRGSETQSIELTATSEPESLPGELPPARDAAAAPANGVAVGRLPIKLPEFAQECLAYIPANYDPAVPHGLLLWLHPPGGFTDDALINRWQGICDKHDLILLAPRSADPAKWEPSELEFIVKAVAQVRADYTIDPARITAAGQQAGGALAYVLAFQNRDIFRAVAALDAPLVGRPLENDPAQPLTVYTASAQDSRFAEPIQAGIAALRELKYAVAVKDLGTKGRDLNPDEIAELGRWLDTLDRL